MTLSHYLETMPRGSIVAAAAGFGLTRPIDPRETRAFGGIGGTAYLFGERRGRPVVWSGRDESAEPPTVPPASRSTESEVGVRSLVTTACPF